MSTSSTINEIARDLSVAPQFIIETLRGMGILGNLTPATTISDDQVSKVRQRLGAEDPVTPVPDPTTVLEFLPDATAELSLLPDVAARLASLEEEVTSLREDGPLEPVAAKKLGEYFRLQHVFHSTGIEGNRLTLRETEVVLLQGIELGEKPLADQLEVKDLDAAFQFLDQLVGQKSPLREIDIRELHRLTVGQNRDAAPGAYRETGVVISGSELRPPEPLAVPGLMRSFVEWVNRQKELNTFAFAIVAHHKLTAIHPFLYGNGRVARLILNLLLLHAGYPIVNIRREDRPRYYEALSLADRGEYSALVGVTLDRALEVFNEMRRVHEETARMKQWAAKLGKKEAELAQRKEEREYRIWLSSFETVKLEFQGRAELLAESLEQVEISFKAYPSPDISKYLALKEKGRTQHTWYFSLRFSNGIISQFFFFRFFRDFASHPISQDIPLQLNWFQNKDESPVDNTSIHLRELWFDRKRILHVRQVQGAQIVTTQPESVAGVAEQFFEDVLKTCFGIG